MIAYVTFIPDSIGSNYASEIIFFSYASEMMLFSNIPTVYAWKPETLLARQLFCADYITP